MNGRVDAPDRPSAFLKLVLPILALLLVLAAASAGAAAAAKPPVAEEAVGPQKAHRGGNKIFDVLEARRAGAGRGERIEVLGALTARGTAEGVAETSRRAGAVDVRRRFGIVDGFSAAVNKGQLEA